MTTDLWMLVWSGILCLGLTIPYGVGRVMAPGGNEWGFGNRDTEIAVAAWVGRAVRAHLNLVENLPTFAILVLVAHVSGHANATTALGAEIFFWARVAHAATYIGGIIYARTGCFFIGLVGEIMILKQLF